MTKFSKNLNSAALKLSVHEKQKPYLLEKCLLVNKNDQVIGTDTKGNCHLNKNINNGMIHRAFSVFLFDSRQKLLMQERSDYKFTFPGYLTNTCCSHPLEHEQTDDIITGIKHAIIRKLQHELNIKDIKESDLKYKARFYYKAIYDDVWGENEIDYVFLAKKDVQLEPNPDEVKCFNYFGQEKIKDLIKNESKLGIKISPWFKLIAQNFLYDWWDNLDNELVDEPIGDIKYLSTITPVVEKDS